MMELLPDDDPTPVAPVTVEVVSSVEPLPPEPEPYVPPESDSELRRNYGPEMPVALVFQSRGGGSPHVVTVLDMPLGRVVSCCCKAVRFLGIRPKGCWAMVRAREMLGIEPIA